MSASGPKGMAKETAEHRVFGQTCFRENLRHQSAALFHCRERGPQAPGSHLAVVQGVTPLQLIEQHGDVELTSEWSTLELSIFALETTDFAANFWWAFFLMIRTAMKGKNEMVLRGGLGNLRSV